MARIAGDFELVVLDFDGTLADTRPAISATLTDVVTRACGAPPDPSRVQALVGQGRPLDATLAALVASSSSPSGRDLSDLVQAYRDAYADHAVATRPFPGFPDVLRRLHAAGVRLAVVSNKGERAIQDFLRLHGLAGFFALVVGEVAGRPRKPSAQLLTDHVLPRAGPVATDRILIVGDTDTDLQFARNCGAAACWASFGYGDPAACRALRPRFLISDPSDLLEVVGLQRTALA